MTTPPPGPHGTPGPDEGDDRASHQPPSAPDHGDAAQPPYYPGQRDAGPSHPGYQPYGSGEYGSFGEPVGHHQEPPASILTAVKLMYVGAGLSLLWTLLVFPQRDVLREQLAGQETDLTAAELDAFVNTFVTVLVVIGLITVGLWLWMARANRRGQTWARVVATMLGVLAVVSALIGLAQPRRTGRGAQRRSARARWIDPVLALPARLQRLLPGHIQPTPLLTR